MNKTCGECHYYLMHETHGPWCTKNRRETSYLQTAPDCWTEPGAGAANEVQTKVCKHCGRELPVTNFGRHSKTKDGYQPLCRECMSEQRKKMGEKSKKDKKRQPRTTASKVQPAAEVEDTVAPDESWLHEVSNEQLVLELQRRGFSGRIEKHISFAL